MGTEPGLALRAMTQQCRSAWCWPLCSQHDLCPPSAPGLPPPAQHPVQCRMRTEEKLNKYLLMDCCCAYVSHCPGGLRVPPGKKHASIYAVLSLFGVQYRCDYSNRRLISGPRTRIFIAGQEVLSVVSGAVPTILCLPLASVILFSVHLCPWRRPTPTPSASPPHPPPPPRSNLPPPRSDLPPPTPCVVPLCCLPWLRIIITVA